MAYDWPGNVRELQNEIERGVALARDGERIGLAHLSSKLVAPRATVAAVTAGRDRSAAGPGAAPGARRLGGAALASVLQLHNGNVSRAARALGISRYMLQRKMKDYELRGRDETPASGPEEAPLVGVHARQVALLEIRRRAGSPGRAPATDARSPARRARAPTSCSSKSPW